jgi:hypothetical protein
MAPSATAVFFAGGEAMPLTPFRAGSAHVVQLGAIGIENPRHPFRNRRAETPPDITREGADERQFIGDRGTCCHHLESHLFPPAVLAEGNLDALALLMLRQLRRTLRNIHSCDDYATQNFFRGWSPALHHKKNGAAN